MLSPSMMTRSKAKTLWNVAIWSATSYCGFSPVPESPMTANLTDPGRFGSRSSWAAGHPAADRTRTTVSRRARRRNGETDWPMALGLHDLGFFQAPVDAQVFALVDAAQGLGELAQALVERHRDLIAELGRRRADEGEPDTALAQGVLEMRPYPYGVFGFDGELELGPVVGLHRLEEPQYGNDERARKQREEDHAGAHDETDRERHQEDAGILG